MRPSNHNIAHLDAAEWRLGHMDTLQPPFSAIRREAAVDLLPWCDAHGTGMIVYSPMQSGLLSGRMTAARAAALPPDDWRARHAAFNEPELSCNLALAEALELDEAMAEIAESINKSGAGSGPLLPRAEDEDRLPWLKPR